MLVENKELVKSVGNIKDPGFPELSIKELGILREIEIKNNGVTVTITPTYPGCPALGLIEDEITSFLKNDGWEKIEIIKETDPPWSTSVIPREVYRKMKICGVAPPVKPGSGVIECPKCNSASTEMMNRLGTTACRSVYFCNECKETFEYFRWV